MNCCNQAKFNRQILKYKEWVLWEEGVGRAPKCPTTLSGSISRVHSGNGGGIGAITLGDDHKTRDTLLQEICDSMDKNSQFMDAINFCLTEVLDSFAASDPKTMTSLLRRFYTGVVLPLVTNPNWTIIMVVDSNSDWETSTRLAWSEYGVGGLEQILVLY